MVALPQDIKHRDWLTVIRRLQSVATNKNLGLAAVNITILVDSDGRPVSWTEPKVTKLEPWRRSQHLLDLLTAPPDVP